MKKCAVLLLVLALGAAAWGSQIGMCYPVVGIGQPACWNPCPTPFPTPAPCPSPCPTPFPAPRPRPCPTPCPSPCPSPQPTPCPLPCPDLDSGLQLHTSLNYSGYYVGRCGIPCVPGNMSGW